MSSMFESVTSSTTRRAVVRGALAAGAAATLAASDLMPTSPEDDPDAALIAESREWWAREHWWRAVDGEVLDHLEEEGGTWWEEHWALQDRVLAAVPTTPRGVAAKLRLLYVFTGYAELDACVSAESGFEGNPVLWEAIKALEGGSFDA